MTRKKVRRLRLVYDDQFLELWASAMTNLQLGEILGISGTSLIRTGKRFGLPPRYPNKTRGLRDSSAAAFRVFQATGRIVPHQIPPAWPDGHCPDPDGALVKMKSPKSKNARLPHVPLSCSPMWDAERDSAVIKTQGRYEKIGKLAKKWNIDSARVLLRWHQLRVV